ncbi:MAG TPA: PhnD/SsuA/transferrin family substrate-binding protein [Rhizobiaceae bacterium]|nr:PhnD/SsuA/transferrin family substrate-binding protein [Rhizobiaceae bacterium]
MTGWSARSAQALGVAILSLLTLSVWPAHADWRKELGTFRIGMLAEQGGGHVVTGLAEIKRAYSMALGLPVEVLVAEDYASLIQAQAAGRLEYAIYSATGYATAYQLCACIEPIVAPVAEDGATGMRAVLITRDGKLKSVDDIGAHRVAIVRKDNISGFAIPGSPLGAAFEKAGSAIQKVDTAAAAETMLVDGSVDAIFGWVPASAVATAQFPGSGTLERLHAAGIDPASLSVIWTSDLIRFGPHALRSDLDAEAKSSLTIFLTTMFSQSPDIYDLVERERGGGFRTATHAEYEPVLEAVKRIAETEQAPNAQ